VRGGTVHGRSGHAVVIAVLWLLPTLFFAIFALDLKHENIPTDQRLVYAGLTLLFGLLTYRTLTIGVRVREQDVIVRGVLRSRRVPWERIEAFEMGLWGGFPCGVVQRTDRLEVTIFALNPPVGGGGGVDAVLRDLNAELERHRP